MIKRFFLFIFLMIFLVSCNAKPSVEFDGEHAYVYAQSQVEFGPRTPGSEAHQKTIELITEEMNSFGWTVDIQ